MKVMYYEVGKKPVVKEIDGSLRSMQNLVGGYIEEVAMSQTESIVCDEEGKLKYKPDNRVAFTEDGELIDVISGDFFVVGISDDDFAGLTDNQISRLIEHDDMRTCRPSV